MATRETSKYRLDIERRDVAAKAEAARKEVLPTETIVSLASEGIVIPKVAKNITIGDVENLRPDRIYATNKTTITARYLVEKIPVPSVNNVLTLSSINRNFFNKPKLISVDQGDNEELIYVTNMNNYLISSGGNTILKISGDANANYVLVLKDITNNEYYDWDSNVMGHGYKEKVGQIIESSSIDGNGPHTDVEDKVEVFIPGKSLETTYNLFFKSTGSTIYDSSLPTQTNPWVINQLPEVTTTFKFIDAPGFEYDQTTTITHSPEADLSKGINSGKTTVTITTIAKRGTLSLTSMKAIDPRVFSYELNGNASFLDEVDAFDLIASVDGMVGTITGTVKINKAAIRDENLTFSPRSFFKII